MTKSSMWAMTSKWLLVVEEYERVKQKRNGSSSPRSLPICFRALVRRPNGNSLISCTWFHLPAPC